MDEQRTFILNYRKKFKQRHTVDTPTPPLGCNFGGEVELPDEPIQGRVKVVLGYCAANQLHHHPVEECRYKAKLFFSFQKTISPYTTYSKSNLKERLHEIFGPVFWPVCIHTVRLYLNLNLSGF
jgi:hypothetical protein